MISIDEELDSLLKEYCNSDTPKNLKKNGPVTDNVPHKIEGVKLQRNSPCPCGSGVKYKKCCK